MLKLINCNKVHQSKYNSYVAFEGKCKNNKGDLCFGASKLKNKK